MDAKARTFVVVLIVFLAGTLIPLASRSTAGIVDPEPDVVREVYVYGSSPARSSCQSDTCLVGLPEPVDLVLPDVGVVDVTVTLGITYRTSAGDTARIDMKLKQPGSPRASMAPGHQPLRPGGTTSTTLTWARRAIDSGQTLTFTWLLGPHDAGNPPFDLEVTRAVLVATATPS